MVSSGTGFIPAIPEPHSKPGIKKDRTQNHAARIKQAAARISGSGLWPLVGSGKAQSPQFSDPGEKMGTLSWAWTILAGPPKKKLEK